MSIQVKISKENQKTENLESTKEVILWDQADPRKHISPLVEKLIFRFDD